MFEQKATKQTKKEADKMKMTAKTKQGFVLMVLLYSMIAGWSLTTAADPLAPPPCQDNPEMLGGYGLAMKMEAETNGIQIYCHHNPGFSGLPRPLGIHGFDYSKGRATDHRDVPSPRINFGDIRPGSGSELELDDWEGDWCWRRFSYFVLPEDGKDFFNEKQRFSVTTGRVHPGVTVESDCDFLSMFTGNDIDTPGYAAWRNGDRTEIQPLESGGAAGMEFSGLENVKWFLFWHGRDATVGDRFNWLHYGEDPRTVRMKVPVRGVQTFKGKGDIPLLVVCLKPAFELQSVPGIGLEFTFLDGVKAVVLPIYGLNHPSLEETLGWARGLPESVAKLCDEWAEQVTRLPLSARESYSYEPDSDTVIITEAFEYEESESGDSGKLAPLPPMLALAMTMGMPMEIRAGGKTVEPRDTGLLTAYGPYMVVDDAGSYEIRLSGLGKYAGERRAVKPRPADPSGLYLRLEQRLAGEIDAMLQAGHLAGMAIPSKTSIYSAVVHGDEGQAAQNGLVGAGRWYANTGLALQTLCRAWDVMPGDRAGLSDYTARERAEYPPENVGFAPGSKGARREAWPMPEENVALLDGMPSGAEGPWAHRFHRVRKLIPIENLYGLAEYYLTAGKDAFAADNQDGKLSDAVNAAMAPWLERPEWASFGWRGWDVGMTRNDIEYGGNRTSDANRMIAGLIGYVRLMRLAGRADDAELGTALLGRALAQRHAIARYAEYLYGQGVLPLPEGESPLKDIRQVSVDEQGVYLYTLTGYYWCMGAAHYLGPYMGMVPELGRFAAEHFKKNAEVYVSEIARIFPDWFMRFGCTPVESCEDHINKPTDSQQVFNTRAWVLGQTPEELAKFVDAPWAKVGDWYFIERLAETLIACRGVEWE